MSPGGFGPRGNPEAPESGAPQPVLRDPSHWAVWWRYNRDAYLPIDTLLAGLEAGSGEDSALGAEAIRRDILPALEAPLRAGGDEILLRDCMLALSRVDVTRAEGEWGAADFARNYLGTELAGVQEAALLALGSSGDTDSIPFLASVLRDEPAAREALGGLPIAPRHRAFAAYSLGLLGRESHDEEAQLKAVHALLDALGNERTATREIQVACVLAAGLVPLQFCADDPERLERHRMEGDRHLCGGVQLKYLLDVVRDESLDPWVRAHAAPAIGRLGVGAPDDFRSAVVELLAQTLDSRSEAEAELRQGAVIGLGLFADVDKDDLDSSARRALEKVRRKGDRLERRLASVALARVAGRPGDGSGEKALGEITTNLTRELSRGKEGARGWAALSLAVLGYEQLRGAGGMDPELVAKLRSSVMKQKEDEDAAASALALAILRDDDSASVLRTRFARSEDPGFQAFASLALGLLGDSESRPMIEKAWEESREGEDELGSLDLALALRFLGDRDVSLELAEVLASDAEVEDRVAIAEFLAALDDARTVPALVSRLKDSEEESEVRAACARALGRLCDRSGRPWTAIYSNDVHYSILTWTLESPFDDGTGLLDRR